jgi:hypothetical protein
VLFEIGFIAYLGISILLLAVNLMLLESSPVGLEDNNGFYPIGEEA